MIGFIPLEAGTEVCRLADALYIDSFPEVERAPLPSLHSFALQNGVTYAAVCDGGFRGIIFTVEDDGLIFLLYLAIHPEHRGEGLGTAVLDLLSRRAGGRRIFLNAEPPDEGDDRGARIARIRFYRGNGFSDSGKVTTSDGQRYLLMHRGGYVLPEEAAEFYARTGVDRLFSPLPRRCG